MKTSSQSQDYVNQLIYNRMRELSEHRDTPECWDELKALANDYPLLYREVNEAIFCEANNY